MQVMTALAARAAQSDALPPQLRSLLHLNVGEVVGQLDALAQKQIRAAIPGQLGNEASNVVQDPAALTKDPAKALQDLGGLGSKPSGSQEPAGRRPNPH
jgi:hypothetical protein